MADLPECTCIEDANDDLPAHLPGCPRYTDCGGQTSDPPCGGRDRCLWDQYAYYRMLEREPRTSQ